MGKAPDTIKRLVDRFTQQADQIRSPDYNETLIRIDFINPLMAELGWDIENKQGFAEQYREVVHEDRVKVAGANKAPDYSFRVGGQRKFFLEAKKPFVKVKTDVDPAYQLRRYGWSAKLAVSLLSDFEEFAIYDCRVQPKLLDKASTARREYITYTEYEPRWEFIEGTFSKRAVLQGEFDRYCETKKGRGASLVDDAFLGEIEEWRKDLAGNLALRNEKLSEGEMNFAVQRIIDRILFLRIAEDRGTEPVGQLQALLSGDSVYKRLVTLFNRADERYNSGLFHFAKEKDRDESPDTLTPTLDVDDKALKAIFKRLYYPESPYEFTMISADILGSVYERFLGKIITLTAGHRAKIEEKPEVRKAGGVYYTPVYIVDYIVKNTVGKLLGTKGEGGAPAEPVAPIRSTVRQEPHPPSGKPFKPPTLKLLDPACGSGSFLIGAYQFLLDWYHQQYLAADPEKLVTLKNPVLRPAGVATSVAADNTAKQSYALTISERKRILLDHIHGVDLDSQAVEVTKLNLLLKCLEGETSQTLGFEGRLFRERALPDLGNNILCGNSLIGTDIIGTDAWTKMTEDERARVNPFDYERAFPQVFKGKDGGFDAVIGNPPYVRQESIIGSKGYFESRFRSFSGTADLFVFFMERGISLLSPRGKYAVIVSSSVLRSSFAEELREYVQGNFVVESITDFGGLPVFADAKDTYVCIPVISRGDALADPVVNKVSSLPDGNVAKLNVSASYPISRDRLKRDAWPVSSDTEHDVLEVVLRRGAPLGKLAEGQIFYGIKTGLNHAFVIGTETRDRLISEHPSSADVIKPLIGGEDIRRYQVNRRDQWLIFTRRGSNIDAFPAIRRHLSQWKAELTPKTRSSDKVGRKPGRYRWHEIQDDVAYFAAFDAPKIIYPDISIEPRFHLDESGLYASNTVYCLGSSSHKVLGFLNSKLFWFCIAGVSIPFGTRGGRYRYRLFSQYMEQMPIADQLLADSPVSRNLDTAVRSVVSLHKRLAAEKLPQKREQIEREIAATDRQIDQLVYQLYGLTEDEIRIVEETTKS